MLLENGILLSLEIRQYFLNFLYIAICFLLLV